MSTHRLYYTDSYATQFDALITETSTDRMRVYLDKTAFYPTSGGQPNDLGTMNGVPVFDVIDEGDRIVHCLEKPLTAQVVAGAIDWERRYDHMQQHTGQHLLSAIFQDSLGAETISFHMGAEVSTIDLAVEELSEASLMEAEDRANDAARQAVRVDTLSEDAESKAGLRKQSARSGTLRIVAIAGLDRSACGGTHVRNTSEVLPIQLRRLEKVRGNLRVGFACGARATRHSRQDFRTLSKLGQLAGTSHENIVDCFKTMRQRLSEAEKDRQRLTKRLAEYEGRALYAAAAPCSDGVRRCCQRVEVLDEAQRTRAQAYAGNAKAVLLLVAPNSVLVTCSEDAGFHAGVILKRTLAMFGGSGGGSVRMAQGTSAGTAFENALAAALGFEADNLLKP